MLDDDLLLHAQADLVEPEVDDLSAAAAARVEDRHQQAIGAVDARPAVEERQGDGDRRAVGKPRRELHAGEGLRDAIVAALPGEGAGLPERRDAQDGQAGIARVQRLGRQAGGFEPPGPQVLDERVGRREERRQPTVGREVGELGPHRVLAAVLGLEVEDEDSPGMPGPSRRSGDPPAGSTLMTVAPRSASTPPANSPARVSASSTTTTPSRAPPRAAPSSPSGRGRARRRRLGRHARACRHSNPKMRAAFLKSHFSLTVSFERQRQVLLDQRLVGLPHESRRHADQHLVLDQRIAELHEHLPARAALAEVLRPVRGGVHVQVRMPPHERDHLVHPRPAAEAADEGQLGKVHGDLVEVPRVAEVVGAIRRVVHGRVDADGDLELGGLRVQRVEAPVARGNAVHQRRHAERMKPLVADAALELPHAAHPLECADAGEAEDPAGISPQELGDLVVVDAERQRALDAQLAEHLHERRPAPTTGGGPRPRCRALKIRA